MSNSSNFNSRIKNYIKNIIISKSKISVAYKGLVQEYLQLIDKIILNEKFILYNRNGQKSEFYKDWQKKIVNEIVQEYLNIDEFGSDKG
jgi:hypothetical protein